MIGDFNLPGISAENWEESICENVFEQNFIDMFNDLDLKQLIQQPTHNKGKILDLVLTTHPQNISNINVLDENLSIKSDHFAISFQISEKIKKNKKRKRKIYNYTKANWNALNLSINSFNWNSIFIRNDVEKSLKFFEDKLNKLCKEHIPMITITDNKQPTWYDAEVFAKGREKDKWRKKYKNSKSNSHYMKFSISRSELKKLR